MAKTSTVRLVALGRGRQVYGTRSLVAGEEFEMSPQYADLLIRTGKAMLAGGEPAPRPAPAPPKPPPPQEEQPDDDENDTDEPEPAPSRGGDDIEPLRAQARALGVMVDGRWGVVRLQHEIKQRQ
jgi:hypothetical protein